MTDISIRTHLDSGIYASQGGGQTIVHYRWNAGPLNLLKAAAKMSEHRKHMVQCYGNIGCGRSWLYIGDVAMDEEDIFMELEYAKWNGKSRLDVARAIIADPSRYSLARLDRARAEADEAFLQAHTN